MLDTEDVLTNLRTQTGTELIADLGLVHQGNIGYSNCKVSVGIESWQKMYFVCISVVHRKNRAGSHTRIIKWPYSLTSASDLENVFQDLNVLEHATSGMSLTDQRNLFARGFDKIMRREYIGQYRFVSPLESEPLYGSTVTATVVRMSDQLEVSLVEARSKGVIILAQFPLEACTAIRHALITFSLGYRKDGPN